MMLCKGTLCELEFIQQGRPCIGEAFDDRRIEFRHRMSVDGCTRGGSDSSGITDIFHSNRNTMERPTVFAVHDLLLRSRCLSQSKFGRHRRIGMQVWLKLLDAV